MRKYCGNPKIQQFWTNEELRMLAHAIKTFGFKAKLISEYVKTKDYD